MNGPFELDAGHITSIAGLSARTVCEDGGFFQNLIVGGGPAGLAPLISASRSASLNHILSDGVAVLERGSAIGPGAIGGYAINSDSSAQTLVSCILDSHHQTLSALRCHPAVQAVAALGHGSVPLKMVAALLAAIGNAFNCVLTETPGCAVLIGHEAIRTSRTIDGLWRTELRRMADGQRRSILSRNVVLATGGEQPRRRLETLDIAGTRLLPRYEDKVIHSNEALTAAGLETIGRRLSNSSQRRVAIVGGSSSAIACAYAILNASYGDATSVTVLHQRPLRVFYPSAEAARNDGYEDFSPEDICPISGFVFRFAGFRLESRELVISALGIGGRTPDKRLRLHRLTPEWDPIARTILDGAELIIAAVGYRPRALPVFATSGGEIKLSAVGLDVRPLVDNKCRVLDVSGLAIPGLFGIGLAAGFNSPETIGGEPSFAGQTNSLWQWQNGIGAIIAQELLDVARKSLERQAFDFQGA